MPRGEETQVPPQEGEASREVKAQDEVKEQETKRDQEVIEEPTAVIERERPVQESEAIEAELKAAVGSVRGGGQETEDREEQISLGEEISSTPINTPAPADEISLIPENDGVGEILQDQTKVEAVPAPDWEEEPPKPPPGRMEDGGPKTEDEKTAGKLDETSFKVESPVEVEEVILDGTSFKVETPLPDQGVRQEGEGETARSDASVETEVGEILAEGDFKPVPAEEGAGEDKGPGTGDGVIEGGEGEEPAGQVTEEGGEEGGSILIGEEGEEEIEQIDLTEEVSKEVEEYWEPPDMYMHVNTDGTRTIVDASGNPVESPPLYELVVDKNGVEHVQALYSSVSGGTPKFEIPFYSASLNGLKIHFGEGGAINVVDKGGNLIKSPPIVTKVVDEKGAVHVYAQYPGMETGEKYELEVFSKPIDPQQTFVYMGQDGKIQVVDSTGKPIPIPPVVLSSTIDKNGVKIFEVSYLRPDNTAQEVKVTLSNYKQSLEGLFVHVGQDGSYNVVDATGKPIESPPILEKYVDGSGVKHIKATYPGFEEGSAKGELNFYKSAIGDVYIHHGADNAITVVDKDGKPIDSPPIISKVVGSKGEEIYSASYSDGTSGTIPINITAYSAPIQNMYVHFKQDGTISVVDKYGTPVESPPLIKKITDNSGIVHIYASYPGITGSGQQIELGFYKPVLSKED